MIRTREQARALVARHERSYEGKNYTRWYSTVRSYKNGEAVVDTWAVKTFKGKPKIMWASEYHTDGLKNMVSGRCLVHYLGGHFFNWLDFGGRRHIAVWDDVDACRNEVLEQRDHEFGKGAEFYGEYLNGFADTKYKYAQIEHSGMRVSDFLDCYRVSPHVENLVKAGLHRWLSPNKVKSLMSNKPLMRFVARHAEELRHCTPMIVSRLYKMRGDALTIDEILYEHNVVAEKIKVPFKAKRICEWCERNGVSLHQLADHIANLRELGMSVSYEPHVLPSDFGVFSLEVEQRVYEKREEDRLAREAEREMEIREANEIRHHARAVIANWLEKGLVIPKGYDVIVPTTETEMVAEGDAMHNCVGRVVKNNTETSLFFLHKDGLPYIDVSVKDGRITEIRYSHNRSVDRNSKDYKMCTKIASAFKKAS